MDEAHKIIDPGRIYIDTTTGRIDAVISADDSPPAGYAAAEILDTHGTIYPGLIELHNHLCYNILRQWQVPQHYDNRAQWRGCVEYHRRISVPMKVITKTTGLPSAVVRYVECKCLMGGVTTSQGLSLVSQRGLAPYWGQLRNAEKPGDKSLPHAAARIDDVTQSELDDFIKQLKGHKCVLLHLSEGVDSQSRKYFCNLTNQATHTCAVTPSLAGIHCTALNYADYDLMENNNASMIWSPLSNFILYGDTARIADAKKNNLVIGIGADWSPTGSKNLLWELKVARLYSSKYCGEGRSLFSDQELVDMATRNAAKILKWDHAMGTIEKGKLADLLVLCGVDKDPYAKILEASERDVQLVTVGGMPRYGRKATMEQLTGETEPWTVGGERYLLKYRDISEKLVDDTITLAEACTMLSEALADIKKLAAELEKPRAQALYAGLQGDEWTLYLDHGDPPPLDTLVPVPERTAEAGTLSAGRKTRLVPLIDTVGRLELDPLTVIDDRGYIDGIWNQCNVPDYIKEGLWAQYQAASGQP